MRMRAVATIVFFVWALLGFCNAQDSSLCDKYATANGLTGLQLMTNVVQEIVTNVAAPGSPLLNFFDGTTPSGSTDFTTRTAALARLTNALITFFGSDRLFNCTDGTIGEYPGNPNMKYVHRSMPIYTVIHALESQNVTPEDALWARSALDNHEVMSSTRVIVDLQKPYICNQEGCSNPQPCGKPSTIINFNFDGMIPPPPVTA